MLELLVIISGLALDLFCVAVIDVDLVLFWGRSGSMRGKWITSGGGNETEHCPTEELQYLLVNFHSLP